MKLSDKIRKCEKCKLSDTRTQVVIGRGSFKPIIMFIGEAPGKWEDRKGKPFVGNAGSVLDSAIKQLGLSKKDYYITNIVKCRPVDSDGNNRPPTDKEKEICGKWLDRQVGKLSPIVVVPLGNHATQYVLSTTTGITKLAGRPKKYGRIIVFPLLHPAAILHNPKNRKRWDKDLQKLAKYLDEKGLVNLRSKQINLKRWLDG